MREIPTPTFDLSPIALPRGLLHRPLQPHPVQTQQIVAPTGRSSIEVSWAKHQDEVREAQRLRFDVFATEMGANLQTPIQGMTLIALTTFASICWYVMLKPNALSALTAP